MFVTVIQCWRSLFEVFCNFKEILVVLKESLVLLPRVCLRIMTGKHCEIVVISGWCICRHDWIGPAAGWQLVEKRHRQNCSNRTAACLSHVHSDPGLPFFSDCEAITFSEMFLVNIVWRLEWRTTWRQDVWFTKKPSLITVKEERQTKVFPRVSGLGVETNFCHRLPRSIVALFMTVLDLDVFTKLSSLVFSMSVQPRHSLWQECWREKEARRRITTDFRSSNKITETGE